MILTFMFIMLKEFVNSVGYSRLLDLFIKVENFAVFTFVIELVITTSKANQCYLCFVFHFTLMRFI